ncbi:MAG: hypothetical protein ACREUV_04040 [Burkholderiales bacterium]
MTIEQIREMRLMDLLISDEAEDDGDANRMDDETELMVMLSGMISPHSIALS